MRFDPLKKLLILLTSAAAVSTLYVDKLHAQGGDPLVIIAANTTKMVVMLEKLPEYIKAFLDKDDSASTKALVDPITQLGDLILNNQKMQSDIIAKLDGDLINNPGGNNVFLTNAGQPISSSTTAADIKITRFPIYKNDLSYSTLLADPDKKEQSPRSSGTNAQPLSMSDAAYNYIKNAGGVNLPHRPPESSWDANRGVVRRYQAYFNTVMAAESFNSYALSYQKAQGNQLNTLQATLVAKATDPKNWLAEVAGEQIGWVIRQILIYQSQVFVLMTQLVQTQQQMVTAQVMTNALIIAGNLQTENIMASTAAGDDPSI